MDFEDLNELLDGFKAKLREELSEEFNSKLNTITDKFGDLLKKQLNNINSVIKEQKEKIQQLEKKSRDKNLIIHGVGFDKENDLESVLLRLIREKLQIEIEKSDIDHIVRMGKNKSSTKRPILLSLTTRRKKIEILRSCRRLKGSKISITEDYPEDVQRIRKALTIDMMEARKKGHYAIIKYDKLVVLEKRKENKKRELSVSPLSGDQHAKVLKQSNTESGRKVGKINQYFEKQK